MLRRRDVMLLHASARRRVGEPRMLVLVAVDAQQLPVRAVGRIVVVVAVLVVHRELAQALAVELARAARADPRQDLQGLGAVICTHQLHMFRSRAATSTVACESTAGSVSRESPNATGSMHASTAWVMNRLFAPYTCRSPMRDWAAT